MQLAFYLHSSPGIKRSTFGAGGVYSLSKKGRKEQNVLFNDALNTFYLRLYGVRHMVKDHSDSERGNPLPPHRLLFPINSKDFLYAPSHRQLKKKELNCGKYIYTYSQKSFHPVLHDWCNKGYGMCYPVCGMVHIKVHCC